MSVAFLISIVEALLIAGFLFWAVRYIVSCVPLEGVIAKVIDAVIVIAAVAVVLFWVVIPVLHLLAGVHLAPPR